MTNKKTKFRAVRLKLKNFYLGIGLTINFLVLLSCGSVNNKRTISYEAGHSDQSKMIYLPVSNDSLKVKNLGECKGTALTFNNEPLSLAKITLIDQKGHSFSTYSEIDGLFLIQNLAPGMYNLKISDISCELLILDSLVIRAGKMLYIPKIVVEERNETLKPIIYLYPEKRTKIEVKLDFEGVITHSYPAYKDSWNVVADKDGKLLDYQDKEYYALYWEGIPHREYSISEGRVVKGSETVAFLEESLDKLGLSRKEANEFIIFWLPKLEVNKYNLIHFSTDQYQRKARLTISPKPETLIRVMMIYTPLDEPINMKLQDLDPLSQKRNGFTVVEWGGRKVDLSALKLAE